MTPFTLTNRVARRVFLDRHALLEAPQGVASGPALLDLIKRLGFVQLDSINTVARAHDLILFSRRPQYRPQSLKHLYEKDRALLEHWTHDAAVVPMEFYPYWHLRRQRDADVLRNRWRNGRRDGFERQCQPVIDMIRERGPMCSAQVGAGEKRGRGGWWDWHPSKTALEYLWRSGALTVVKRKGFQKYYDLTERVLDAELTDSANAPDPRETIDWCCNQALQRLGFATHRELALFWDHISPAEAKGWCAQALLRGDIVEVLVTGDDGATRSAFARPDIADDPALDLRATARVRVLSPFDPALRDRKRAERLFGFRYRIEVFVPQAKRTYGYYVFPIMQGDRLIARVDMKADRNENTLRVRSLWPERGVRWSKARHTAFETELDRIKRLAGVKAVTFEKNWLQGSK